MEFEIESMTPHSGLWQDQIHGEEYHEAIREILAPQYQNATPEEIDNFLAESIEGMTEEEIEGFLSGIKSLVTQVAPAVLPLAGTVVGSIYGGPPGGAAGGAVGGMLGNMIGGNKPPPKNRGTPAPVQKPSSNGSRAASQILGLINNPKFIQSLLSLVMKEKGTPSLPVGSTGTKNAPLGAFMNLLGQLAGRVTTEAHEIHRGAFNENVPSYLLNEGETHLVADPASPGERADVLLNLLNEEYKEDAYYEEAYPEDEYDSVANWFAESGLIEDDPWNY